MFNIHWWIIFLHGNNSTTGTRNVKYVLRDKKFDVQEGIGSCCTSMTIIPVLSSNMGKSKWTTTPQQQQTW